MVNYIRRFLSWILSWFNRRPQKVGPQKMQDEELNANYDQLMADGWIKESETSANILSSRTTSFQVVTKPSKISIIEEFHPFELPSTVRRLIFEYLSYADVKEIRLVCSKFKDDVDRFKGVVLKLSEQNESNECMPNVGVSTLNVRNLMDRPRSDLFKRPELLKELRVTGTVTIENLNWIIQGCPNIRKLAIEVSPYSLNGCPMPFNEETFLPLKMAHLSISAFVFEQRDHVTITTNLILFMDRIRYNSIVDFEFHIILTDLMNLQVYHREALKFIMNNYESLKRINVQVKHMLRQNENDQTADDASFNPKDRYPPVKKLHLSIGRYLEKWQYLLDSQTELGLLHLNIPGRFWECFRNAIQQSHLTLRILILINLTVRDGQRAVPLDLAIFRDCSQLERLVLFHEEHVFTMKPKLARSALIPSNLENVSFSRFVVKPHQLLFLLLRLPRLKRLELGYWAESETTLGAFLQTFPFILRFNVTDLSTVVLYDERRILENRNSDIDQMEAFLRNSAQVTRYTTGRELKIVINKLPTFIDQIPSSEYQNYAIPVD